jgi:putative peptidoglycan lipid II flippase
VFAIVIGQTALADAYNGANNSPNAIYELLLGGVLSASLVPLFTQHAEERDDDATSAVVTMSVSCSPRSRLSRSWQPRGSSVSSPSRSQRG